MKLTKRILSLLLGLLLLLPITTLIVFATESDGTGADTEKVLRLYYDEPAELTPTNDAYTESFDGWHSSLPLGNGSVGATVFGGTERERIQLTEKSFFASSTSYISSRYSGGLENFAETYISFDHAYDSVTNYSRTLTLSDAVATVSYDYDGVTYTREVFTSYPDNVVAIHLTASEGGALSFTLAPEIPYLRDADDVAASEYYSSGMEKTGEVVADAESATVTLSGTASYYNLNYEALYRIQSDGTYTADNTGDFGTLTVEGASEATIYVALGTNYELTEETFTASRLEKLDATVFPHDTLAAMLDAVCAMDYATVRERHVNDHSSLYGRVEVDFGGTMPSITTDEMLYQYREGNFDNNYVYELYYQIGRYFEIATSRAGTLPSNLVGGWCVYQFAPWTGGNWYNINQQMNYWGVFAANLTETFEAYLEFNEARMVQASLNADKYVLACNPDNYTEPGTNGWLVGTGNNPYYVGTTSPGGHSGVGTVGMTTIDYWNYYLFTLDEEALYNTIFTVLQESARFYTKFAVLDENGLYLCTPSASPENLEDGKAYTTVGCAFDQEMMYENNFNYLAAVEVVRAYEVANGITESIVDEALVATVNEQIEHYDPVIIGLSGQIKEYREEDYYGDIGEYYHRHISQLMGLANGTQINSNTPAWLDAARNTLTLRGSISRGSSGWGDAQRLFGYARCGDGESAQIVLERLVGTHLYNNFWNNHGGVFQIDANFGAMAAISEMLLQSHEGYLNLLPAIPESFADGSFSGLLARGNFTVDLTWENGAPVTLTVTSNKGGELGVYYPGYADISVTDSLGNAVDYTVTDGVIRFDTEEGTSYTVEGFVAMTKAKTPSSIEAEISDYNTVTLSWEASATEGASYNVYRAIESSPTYELIGTTDSLTFTDTEKGDRQATYCVKAYNELTLESLGALVTVAKTPNAPANVEYVEYNGELQLMWDGVDGCTYLVYQDGELLLESELCIAIVPKGYTYSVSALYYENEGEAATAEQSTSSAVDKSALYEIYADVEEMLSDWTFSGTVATTAESTLASAKDALDQKDVDEESYQKILKSLQKLRQSIRYEQRNLAPLATEFTVTPTSGWTEYPVSAITDGKLTTRYAAARVGAGAVVMEFTLDGIRSISQIDIYEFADSGVPRSTATTIEFFVNGEWVSIVDEVDSSTLGTGSSSTFHTSVATDSSLTASKVRITLGQASDSKNLGLWEVQIWGADFNTDASIGSVNVNEEKPTATTPVIDNCFETGDAAYTDRATDANFMAAVHIGEALRDLIQIRLPIADSSRTSSNEELTAFLKGDNTYFTFEAVTDGTVYVVFTSELANFTEERGWRVLNDGSSITVPSGYTLKTLDHDYMPEDNPYYLSRLQHNRTTGSVTGVVAFTWCYALDFKAGDTVSIPTPAIPDGSDTKLTNENLVVLVDAQPVSPYLESVAIGDTFATPDENNNLTFLLPTDTAEVTLTPYVLNESWTVSFSQGESFSLLSDHTVVYATVSDGESSATYTLRLVRCGETLLGGKTPEIGADQTASTSCYADYPISNITDGSITTRMAAKGTGSWILTYDLGAYYTVDLFTLYAWYDNVSVTDSETGETTTTAYCRIGEVLIEGYSGGEWVTLASFHMDDVGEIYSTKTYSMSATVACESDEKVCCIRATFLQNPNGTQKGISIYEFAANGEYAASASPEIGTVTVNGEAASKSGDTFYSYVDSSVTELTIEAIASDPSDTVTYSPSSTLTFDGSKRIVTVTATNVFGQSRTYTLVIQSALEEHNVLLGLTPSFVIGSSDEINSGAGCPLEYMNDGDTSTRMATYGKSEMEFEFTLDGAYTLTELTLYSWADSSVSRAHTITVRALIGEEWVDVAVLDMTEGVTVESSSKVYKTFAIDAEGVEAVRINVTGEKLSIWEIILNGTSDGYSEEEEEATDSFRILYNVTLHSDFDFHLYVPVLDSVKAITLAGEEITLSSAEQIELDGKDYYKLTLPVAAKEACTLYTLTVTMTVGEKTATGTWRVSLLKYFASLLSSDSELAEKALVLDILSYIRAAIVYFNVDAVEGEEDYVAREEALASIDTLLYRYAYTPTAPEVLESTPEMPTSGHGIGGAFFSLDASVSIVLVPEDGYTAEDFTFLVGGKSATVTTDGEYVYVTVAAHRIGDVLTWSVADKDDASLIHTGEFSLGAYYASDAITGSENSTELLSLIERLAAFYESAKQYKNLTSQS